MKVKTNELIGAALDFAVAKIRQPGWEDWRLIRWIEQEFSPSTRGGAVTDLMEQEGISVRTYAGRVHPWAAFQDFGGSSMDGVKARITGPTSRIAVCRCYVAANLGDEVEIPEVLL